MTLKHIKSAGSLVGFAMFASLFLTACEHDIPAAPDENPQNNETTLSDLQTSVFNQSCALSGCHLGANASLGLNLQAGQAFSNLVDVDAVFDGNFKRVVAGNADDSYLFMKITNDSRIQGAQMPLGGSLTQAQIDAVREWIEAGAKNN